LAVEMYTGWSGYDVVINVNKVNVINIATISVLCNKYCKEFSAIAEKVLFKGDKLLCDMV